MRWLSAEDFLAKYEGGLERRKEAVFHPGSHKHWKQVLSLYSTRAEGLKHLLGRRWTFCSTGSPSFPTTDSIVDISSHTDFFQGSHAVISSFPDYLRE